MNSVNNTWDSLGKAMDKFPTSFLFYFILFIFFFLLFIYFCKLFPKSLYVSLKYKEKNQAACYDKEILEFINCVFSRLTSEYVSLLTCRILAIIVINYDNRVCKFPSFGSFGGHLEGPWPHFYTKAFFI